MTRIEYGHPGYELSDIISAASDCGRAIYRTADNGLVHIDGRAAWRGCWMGEQFVSAERVPSELWAVANNLLREVIAYNYRMAMLSQREHDVCEGRRDGAELAALDRVGWH